MSLVAEIRTKKTSFSQYLTQFIQNVVLDQVCLILEGKNVMLRHYPDSFSFLSP